MTEVPPDENPPARDPLARASDGRMLMGVCAGLGRFTGMDPVLFRVGFAVLLLGSGIGVILYIAAFLLMREPGGGPGYVEQWTRRIFDAETVMSLLVAVFMLGLIVNLASGASTGDDRGRGPAGRSRCWRPIARGRRARPDHVDPRAADRAGGDDPDRAGAVSSPSPARRSRWGLHDRGDGGNFRETVKESFRSPTGCPSAATRRPSPKTDRDGGPGTPSLRRTSARAPPRKPPGNPPWRPPGRGARRISAAVRSGLRGQAGGLRGR